VTNALIFSFSHAKKHQQVGGQWGGGAGFNRSNTGESFHCAGHNPAIRRSTRHAEQKQQNHVIDNLRKLRLKADARFRGSLS